MRIAIVNHIEASRRLLRNAVEGHPGWRVVWQTGQAQEAVDLCARDIPDLILMDLLLPGGDGVEAIRDIMRATPCAILVLTASVEESASRVFQALSAGALDAVDTPADASAAALKAFIRKVRTINKLIRPRPHNAQERIPAAASEAGIPMLVAVGASTGGPAALQAMLGQLPADFPGAVVIAQHLDEEFAGGLARWLGENCPLPVAVIKGGERPTAGLVLLAGTNDHLVIQEDGTLAYTAEPQAQPFRPSVDEFFASAALHWPGRILGVLLTGMGQDGARGLLALRRLGHYTLAQDRGSAIVYGMPGAAARFGAAHAQLNPMEIGLELIRLAGLPDIGRRAIKR